mgnify:CR=1 FL=1|jgi:hypothetical protein|tara:strand:+ start:376 stop:666 length:291 start_codon:yes stop_codon:yes gene_type:complete
MPTYTFINSKTKEEWTDMMSISDMEELTKKKHISQVIKGINIVSSTGVMKTDSGWKENLQRIGEAHPGTSMSERYVRKTNKEVKTREVLKKHKVID